MNLKRSIAIFTSSLACSAVLTSDVGSQDWKESDKIFSGAAIGIGMLIIKQECGNVDDGPPINSLVQMANTNSLRIEMDSREAVADVLSPTEREALEIFLATPEGQSISRKMPELLGRLSVVGTTNLCQH